MSTRTHLTAPVATPNLPKGIPYIIGNEAAERFSFYGMKCILTIFMTKYLFLMSDTAGTPMENAEAIARYHDFTGLVYITPVFGAVLADWLLGKYRTILSLSIVYCLGHFALALMGSAGMSAENWMLTGLYLIAIGSGGIKPCVSAHVGDQFGQSNSHWLTKVFGWFYISINVGAALSTLLTPWLLEWYGPHWAFGVPGVLMAIATLLFWMGRNVFVHIPPKGSAFISETFSKEGLLAIAKLMIIFIFVAVFWALFDQTGSSWVLQAEHLDREWLGIEWLPSQIQAINPIMIVTLVPLFGYVLYPAIDKVFPLTPLRKISLGLFLMVPGFAMVSIVQAWIDAGQTPSIGWQLSAYAILTASEVMVSITCLEFAYTQAPKSMKSLVMAVFLASVALGNYFTSGVNKFILVEKGDEESVSQVMKDTMKKADIVIRAAFETADNTLPDTEAGSEHLTSITDEWGTPLQYKLVHKNSFRITSLGPDKTILTPDDIIHEVTISRPADDTATPTTFTLLNADDSQGASPKILKAAHQRLRAEFIYQNQVLPEADAGQAVLDEGGATYGSFVGYVRVDDDHYTLWTPGYAAQTTQIRRAVVQSDQVDDRPLTWRESRLIELKGAEGQKQVDRERGGVAFIEFKTSMKVGGQVKMDGAAYFWFWTWTMLGTAILFVFVALWYTPRTYLQEEEPANEADGELEDQPANA